MNAPNERLIAVMTSEAAPIETPRSRATSRIGTVTIVP